MPGLVALMVRLGSRTSASDVRRRRLKDDEQRPVLMASALADAKKSNEAIWALHPIPQRR